MKHGQVTKLEKKNKRMSKILGNDIMLEDCEAIVIFKFMDNLKQFGSWIPHSM